MTHGSAEMFTYHAWATQRMLSHCGSFSEQLFTKELVNVFPTISEAFEHILSVDEVWFERLKGGNPKGIKARGIHTIKELREALAAVHKGIAEFIDHEADGTRTIVYSNTKGDRFTNSVDEIIRHIANHGTYHRGNIASMFRQLGQQGISTDYIVFLREKSAEA